VTPHPEVLRALAQNLQPTRVTLSIGDSPAFDSSDKALRLSGLAEVATAMGIETADFVNQTDVSFSEGLALRHFQVAKSVAEADGIITCAR
jgi:uncharacterized protein (DUF362 family)